MRRQPAGRPQPGPARAASRAPPAAGALAAPARIPSLRKASGLAPRVAAPAKPAPAAVPAAAAPADAQRPFAQFLSGTGPAGRGGGSPQPRQAWADVPDDQPPPPNDIYGRRAPDRFGDVAGRRGPGAASNGGDRVASGWRPASQQPRPSGQQQPASVPARRQEPQFFAAPNAELAQPRELAAPTPATDEHRAFMREQFAEKQRVRDEQEQQQRREQEVCAPSP